MALPSHSGFGYIASRTHSPPMLLQAWALRALLQELVVFVQGLQAGQGSVYRLQILVVVKLVVVVEWVVRSRRPLQRL